MQPRALIHDASGALPSQRPCCARSAHPSRAARTRLYTAINTLSGHYASYGNKYPVPEKRRTRLQQQYKEIERALARQK